MAKPAESPLLTQYQRIKREHAGNILFFRLGDFYEMFADDALEVSSLLNLTLTSRNGLPMCGVPYHSARSYIARLLKLGKKIAICEQLSSPQKGKPIIERDVTEVVTPGTTVDEDYLENGDSNYLACLCANDSRFAFACIELSTGEFEAASFGMKDAALILRGELERLQIKEIIVQESLLEDAELGRALSGRAGLVINRWTNWLFDGEASLERLRRQFGTESLKGFGLDDDAVEIRAAGALLDYVADTAKSLLPHIRKITARIGDEFTGIDEASLRNLELLRSMQGEGGGFSLFAILDETKTPMGRRLLKQRLSHPLRDPAKIRVRLDLVDALYHDQGTLAALRDYLGRTPDLERHCARLAMRKSHGKDLAALKNALVQFEKIELLTNSDSLQALDEIYESAEARSFDESMFAAIQELRGTLERGLCEEPSVLLTEGRLIREGYNAELDRLRGFRDNGRQLLEAYLEEERRATGISSLKIRYNRLIGYFFEVTKIHLSKIPAHFIKRQGTVGGERFSTARLAELESEINSAEGNLIELEKTLFLELRERAAALIAELGAAARRLAELDTAASLAAAATLRGWTRPVVDSKNRLRIIEGRHPVVEAHLPRGEFIPNDTALDTGGTAFALITGPNMAGKSTYLRQSALIVIMAQMGSFVPARQAEVGIVDRIYCRVGAQDNLARGESTFLVEMNETAFILNTATERSLVIMDEVGRGTGTLDGLSIAQAVCETLLDRIRCRALFATHYHELAEMTHPRLAQRSMRVDEQDGEIIFRRRLVDGPAAESYGLHVARIAGLDAAVLRRAEEIMQALKAAESQKLPPPPTAPVPPRSPARKPPLNENPPVSTQPLFSF